MQKYLDLFCDIDGLKLEEEAITFEEFLNRLNMFEVDGKKLGELLTSGLSNIKITPSDIKQNKIRILYNGTTEYYCTCFLGDIIETALIVLSKGRALRCIDGDDSEVYEYISSNFQDIFSRNKYSIVPVLLRTAIIIPEELDLYSELGKTYISKILWHNINKIIVPGNISGKELSKIIPSCNAVIQSKDNVTLISEKLRKEIEEIDKSLLFDFDDVISEYSSELELFSLNMSYFGGNNINNISAAYSSIIKPIESRYDLMLKMYETTCKLGNGKKYMVVNWETTNPNVLQLLGSLCAIYSYFNNIKVIMNESHAGFEFFEKTLFELSRGNMQSPYMGYKRCLGIRKDISDLRPSIFKSVLRKGKRLNPVISFPIHLKNDKPVYLFPLNMFLSYSDDEQLEAVLNNKNSLSILTIPRNKDISINIRKSSLDDLTSNESVELLNIKNDINKILSSNTVEYLKENNANVLDNPEGFIKDLSSTMLDYLDSGEISFEGGNGKLVLHDWILNPDKAALSVISDYLKYIFSIPNSDSNIREADYSLILRKVLGFSSEEEFCNIYNTDEWCSDITTATVNNNGEIISKGAFASSNYEKSEFYSSVCEMITSVLASKNDSNIHGIGYKYVSIHDLMLATAEVNGNKEVYIVYAPLNPEVLWYVQETGDLENYTIECDSLTGISDNLLNIGSEIEELNYSLENLNTLLNLEISSINGLDSETDKIHALDFYSRLDSSRYPELEDVELKNSVMSIAKGNNILDANAYLDTDDIKLWSKLALWYVTTKFVGFNCNIPNEYPTGVSSETYGISTLYYLYSDYYNVIGFENLEELERIVNPEKHLKYCRVINPYGGVLRAEGLLNPPEMKRILCTTPKPGVSPKYQYINSRFI